jgi:dipeptidyl aminopeptidase/acylaminoacyl peptidase
VFWAPDGSALGYASQNKLWRVGRGGDRPVAICDLPELLFPNDPAREIDFHSPSWLPGRRLVYAVHLEEKASVQPGYEFDLEVFDGAERRPIEVALGGPVGWPTYVPSGYLLVGREEAAPGIWAVPFDPETLRATGEAFLVAPGAASLSASADGSLLYMENSNVPDVGELAWVDRSGQALSILTEPLPGLGEPSLSPDGRHVAFTAALGGAREVLVVGSEGGMQTRLTFTDLHESAPSWWPGSQDVIYSELQGMTSTIVTRPADGSGAPQTLRLESGIGLRSGFTSITPDGRRLIHAQDERGHVTILIAPMSDDGTPGESRPLLQIEPQPNVLDARTSPDGKLIAWVSDDSGQPEVYVSRFPEGTGRWQVSSGGGRLPRWAGDSGELFYVGGSGVGGRAMMAAPVSDEPSVTTGVPAELFRVTDGAGGALIRYAGGFDVAPDGRRVLLVRPASGGEARSRRMILVQNWLEEFRGR